MSKIYDSIKTGLEEAIDFTEGKVPQAKGSHCIYKTPWPGDPRVNIQNNKGKAKSYQVRQVLLAIEKLEINRED